MTLEQLSQIHPLTVKECQTVEDINARFAMRRINSKADLNFFKLLAAHLGGIFEPSYFRFKVFYEYNPVDRSFVPARFRISKFISEKDLIKKRGCIYVSGWNKGHAFQKLNLE